MAVAEVMDGVQRSLGGEDHEDRGQRKHARPPAMTPAGDRRERDAGADRQHERGACVGVRLGSGVVVGPERQADRREQREARQRAPDLPPTCRSLVLYGFTATPGVLETPARRGEFPADPDTVYAVGSSAQL